MELAHLANPWFDTGKRQSLTKDPLGWLDGQCVQGAGTYSPLEFTQLFLHILSDGFLVEALAPVRKLFDDQRLLGISASRGRVAALDPDLDRVWRLAPPFGVASHCPDHCRPRVAQKI